MPLSSDPLRDDHLHRRVGGPDVDQPGHKPEMVRGVVEHGALLHVCGPVTAVASWPAPLSPQHATSPLETSAHADAFPIAIADAPRNPDTVTGVDESIVVPSPSWPSSFPPQHRTVPSESRAHVS
jgi:hypothetical protein